MLSYFYIIQMPKPPIYLTFLCSFHPGWNQQNKTTSDRLQWDNRNAQTPTQPCWPVVSDKLFIISGLRLIPFSCSRRESAISSHRHVSFIVRFWIKHLTAWPYWHTAVGPYWLIYLSSESILHSQTDRVKVKLSFPPLSVFINRVASVEVDFVSF